MKKPSQHLIAEVPRKRGHVELTIGVDLGDVWSHYCTLNQQGEVIDRGRFRTTAKAIDKWFTDVPHARVAMEAGVHSIWISEQLEHLGHEVIVANVRELRAISHRTVEQQEALTLIRARELLVRLWTAAINAVRGLTKACGHRMPASSTKCFAQPGQAAMPPGLKLALGPILAQIAEMTLKIKQYDREIQRMTQTEYAETQPMMTIHGVGHITALTFVLPLGDKTRFGPSRDVGCYLGLRPKRSQSGERDPQLGITKAGNAYLRSLLIECANHILRPHGRDSALRQWGLHLAARGGKQAKNKSVVAVARKLAVLLHHLWTTQETLRTLLRCRRLKKVIILTCCDDPVLR